MNADGEIAPQHYAFLVSESEFDEIFGRTGLNVGDNSDQARFTEVFMPNLVDAFRLARWLAGNRADAEDIVQEASIRAFKNIRGFRGGDPRAWVLTIVRNTSYSWLAKNRPKAVVLSEDLNQGARERIEREATDGANAGGSAKR
jgi:DNA-directed RNA polymerase specialized sigma24 family protein